MKDMVHHPEHYQGKGGLEVWQVQEAFTADLTGVIAGDACALIKYACRWPKKNGVEDLKKIIEYANHLITKLEEKDCAIPRVCPAYTFRIESEELGRDIVSALKELFDRDGHVTVCDAKDLVGEASCYDDTLIGWSDLKGIVMYQGEHSAQWYIGFPDTNWEDNIIEGAKK